MTASIFLDTNVVLYLLSDHADKADQVERILIEQPTVSVQGINEFIYVSQRKMRLTLEESHDLANSLMRKCRVIPLTDETIKMAMHIAQRYRFSHWDSLIIAATQQSGCTILYSEDLQHQQRIDQLTLINPFHS